MENFLPSNVAEWLRLSKKTGLSLFNAMNPFGKEDMIIESEIFFWLSDKVNQEIFAKAWLDYEIESEQLYTVEIPNPNFEGSDYAVTLLKRKEDGNIELAVYSRPDLNEEKFKLTEEEIKKNFEWAWGLGFAKKVRE